MQQARDFLEECECLDAALERLGPADWDKPTQFKNWTINDVVVHLHFWNMAADNGAMDPEGSAGLREEVKEGLQSGTLRAFENERVLARGAELRALWQTTYRDMAHRWAAFDPQMRVQWVGPDMSVRSSMTARQMETWSHGQEIFDSLGLERVESDRIRNVVILGVNTFGWSFKVQGAPVPDALPALALTAPSGAIWDFGEDGSASGRITGSAVEFAQVVTQTRNIGDTSLVVSGDVATAWMARAQCFAGPPENPPEPGTRGKV